MAKSELPLTGGRSAAEFPSTGPFCALLGFLLFVTFPKVLLGLEAFSYIDSGLFAYPVAFYHRESFWHREFPLWNPLSECGIPFMAQWNTMTLYPPSLVYLLLPVPWSFGLFCVGHLFGAGLGMYLLARNCTGSCLAGAVAGTAYAFNGLFWYGIMWPNMIAAACWTPWLLLFLIRAWNERGRWVLAAGAVGALQMLTGGVEFIMQTWLIVTVWCIIYIWCRRPQWKGMLLTTVAAGVVTGGLAAGQLLPFLDLLRHSERAAGLADSGVASMPVSGWANYFIPLFHYCRNVQGILVPAKLSWTGSWYLGVITIALACWGAWKGRRHLVFPLGALVLFGLVLAMGSFGKIYDLAKNAIPVLGMIRFPVKFLFLPTFALPLLAACGVHALDKIPQEKWNLELERLRGLWVAVLVLALLIAGIGWLNPLPNDAVAPMLLSAVVRIFLLCAGGGVLVMIFKRQGRSRMWVLSLFPVLLWADVFTHGSNLSPTVPTAALSPNLIRDYFGWKSELRPGTSRAFLPGGSLRTLLMGGSPIPEVDTQGRRMALFMNYNLLDGAPKVDGLYSLELKSYGLMRRLFLGTNKASGLKDFLGVSHVNNSADVTDWVKRSTHLPLATAGQKPVFLDDKPMIAKLLRDDFEPAAVVYLPTTGRGRIKAQGGGARILETKWSTHRVEVEVEASRAALVVVSRTFYHCWKAYVDGTPTALWRANHGFQAVEVSPGKHTITIVYQDRIFMLGLGISATTLLCCAAAGALFRPKHSTRQQAHFQSVS